MNTLLHFTKMHSLGNDFAVIDLINQAFTLNADLIRQLSCRKTGIGFDQLLVVEPPIAPDADFLYRIYNADGSESGLCGNGARCFARYVIEQHLCPKKNLIVDTPTTRLLLNTDNYPEIAVQFESPATHELDAFDLEIKGHLLKIYPVALGNPHAITFVSDLNELPLEIIGKALQTHPRFPKGVNWGVVQILARNHLRLRTYERGVGETSSCGSNACAAMIVSLLSAQTGTQVKVESSGGSNHVSWEGPGHPYTLMGPAVSVYSGQFLIAYPNRFHHSPFYEGPHR